MMQNTMRQRDPHAPLALGLPGECAVTGMFPGSPPQMCHALGTITYLVLRSDAWRWASQFDQNGEATLGRQMGTRENDGGELPPAPMDAICRPNLLR